MSTYPGVTFYYHRNRMLQALELLEEMNAFEDGSDDGSVSEWTFVLDAKEVVMRTWMPLSFTYETDEWWNESDGLLDLGVCWARFSMDIPLPDSVLFTEDKFQVEAGVSVHGLYGCLNLSSPSNAVTALFLNSAATRGLWEEFGSRTEAIAIVEDDGELRWRPFDADTGSKPCVERGWQKRELREAYLTMVGVPGIG